MGSRVGSIDGGWAVLGQDVNNRESETGNGPENEEIKRGFTHCS